MWTPLGFVRGVTSAGSSTTLQGSNGYAMLFTASATGLIDTIRLFVATKFGTGGLYTVGLYNVNADGTVGSVIGTEDTGVPISAASTTWQSITPSTPFSVTAGTRYYLVIKNTGDATNYVSVVTNSSIGAANSKGAIGMATWTAGAWVYTSNNIPAMLLEYSSPVGAWDGCCTDRGAGTLSITYGLDASLLSNQKGWYEFQSAPIGLNVIGAVLPLYKVGTPNRPSLRLIVSGTSFDTETVDVVNAYLISNGISLFFPDIVKIQPNSPVKAGIANAFTSTSNYVYLSIQAVYPGYAAKIFIPESSKIYSGGALVPDRYGDISLLLDPVNPYFMPPLNRRQLNSMR